MTLARGDIVFSTALVALLETVAKVALFPMAVSKDLNTLAASSIVFNQVAVAVSNAPEIVVMATGRAGNSDWHRLGVGPSGLNRLKRLPA